MTTPRRRAEPNTGKYFYFTGADFLRLLKEFPRNDLLQDKTMKLEYPGNPDGLQRDFDSDLIVNDTKNVYGNSKEDRVTKLKQLLGDKLYDSLDAAYSQENRPLQLIRGLASELGKSVDRAVTTDVRINSNVSPVLFTFRLKDMYDSSVVSDNDLRAENKPEVALKGETEFNFQLINGKLRLMNWSLSVGDFSALIPAAFIKKVRQEQRDNLFQLIDGLRAEAKMWHSKEKEYAKRAGVSEKFIYDRDSGQLLDAGGDSDRASFSDEPVTGELKRNLDDADTARKLATSVEQQITKLEEFINPNADEVQVDQNNDDQLHQRLQECAADYDKAHSEVPKDFVEKNPDGTKAFFANLAIFATVVGFFAAVIKYAVDYSKGVEDRRFGFYRYADRTEKLKASEHKIHDALNHLSVLHAPVVNKPAVVAGNDHDKKDEKDVNPNPSNR